ncbi:hypothetical protein [Staphylococcus gallinarum]|uniref:hypothetical protein n=1 Tax=Staphylococcus gallinarum TaxID=1293 RepID=UPI0030BE12E5
MRIILSLVLVLLILTILLYVPICKLYAYLSYKDERKKIEKSIVDEYKKEQINRIKLDSRKQKLKNRINFKKEFAPVSEEITKLSHELESIKIKKENN